PGFAVLTETIVVQADGQQERNLQFSSLASRSELVTISGSVSDVGVFEPDPAQRVMIRDETLDANPGRPGMPVSIPGMPVESPAGGVKPLYLLLQAPLRSGVCLIQVLLSFVVPLKVILNQRV